MNTLKTPLCDLLNIDYPILQAGMGGVAFGPLAAAVSKAGGLGTIAAISPTPERVEQGDHPGPKPDRQTDLRGYRLSVARAEGKD